MPRLRFKAEEFDAATRAIGYETDDARARLLAYDPTTYSRIRNGQREPTTRFIVAVLTTFPRLTFDRFFEVADEMRSAA